MIKLYYYHWWWGGWTSRVKLQHYWTSSYTQLNQCVLCATGTSGDQVTWEAVISMGWGLWTSKKQALQQHGTVTAPGYFPLTQNCLTHEPLISVKHTHTHTHRKSKKLAPVYMWALKIIFSCNIGTAECVPISVLVPSHFWSHLQWRLCHGVQHKCGI